MIPYKLQDCDNIFQDDKKVELILKYGDYDVYSDWWGGGYIKIPHNYQLLDYIQSIGSDGYPTYIDTDFNNLYNIEVECTYNCLKCGNNGSYNSGTYAYIFANRRGFDNEPYHCFYLSANPLHKLGFLDLHRDPVLKISHAIPNKSLNTVYTIRMIYTSTYFKSYCNGELLGHNDYDYFENDLDWPNLTLFSYNWIEYTNIRDQQFARHNTQLFHFSIKDTTTNKLLVDMYPARRLIDGINGMYDAVRERFFNQAKTDVRYNFTVTGDEIKPLYYPKNYITN